MIQKVRAARVECPQFAVWPVIEAHVNAVAKRDYSMSGSKIRKKARDNASGTPRTQGVLRQDLLISFLESERIWSSSRAKAYALCRIRLLKARLTSIGSVQTHWSDMKTILQAQTESDDSVVDRSDAWSEQDQEDLTSASLHYADRHYTRRTRILFNPGDVVVLDFPGASNADRHWLSPLRFIMLHDPIWSLASLQARTWLLDLRTLRCRTGRTRA